MNSYLIWVLWSIASMKYQAMSILYEYDDTFFR